MKCDKYAKKEKKNQERCNTFSQHFCISRTQYLASTLMFLSILLIMFIHFWTFSAKLMAVSYTLHILISKQIQTPAYIFNTIWVIQKLDEWS